MIKYKLTEEALRLKSLGIDCTPVRGTKFSAGMDLKACIEKPLVILPGEVKKIPTGVCVFLGINEDETTTAELQLSGLYLPRSSSPGLKLENTVGLLDCDYQGESFAKYKNVSEVPITILPGERIIQLMITVSYMNPWTEVESFEETTERDSGGDGSTGKL